MDCLARMLPFVKRLSPSIIVADIGTNDVSPRIIIPEKCIGGAMYRCIEHPSEVDFEKRDSAFDYKLRFSNL